MIVHATLVALRLHGLWRGALLTGPSGAGKSDLALRALAEGFSLVADDRVSLWASNGRVYGAAPPTLAGLIEVRGLGIQRVTPLAFAQITLSVPLTDTIDRMPDEATETLLDVALPTRPLWPFEPAAPLKLRRALESLGAGR
ncbi:serine kinase of HPr protein (carbohydrate metabolism regulator) [Caulobacter ginsengisoli]|uniref:Serine kinase of HPr protein (Carbohydrate metabolism regulator) n=1 Tax=Caulobacter ginsengisoli TaxID=400775 RepID=A0ABU0IUD3_9CAUL|nr:HPr kinase/phosphorylase [Caulobacter ginsengisoli]MDQ0465623.1 serine kinase of HPr protein (carbohydrate metabolism regulator) [Caulobacter ginsengisoli]